MYIKRINNVMGYKDLPNGFNADFNENTTYIIGANFQRKTTVGSLFNWCLTGTSLNGKEKEQVANDVTKVQNVIVDITFVDNFGIEHRLIRDKGKEMHLSLDGKEIKQEMLAQFYHDKDIFLVAHNPYYFFSLEPKQQKDLLNKILPSINPKEIFECLEESEKEVIGNPIENLSSYIDKRNNEINELKKEYDKNSGKLQAYKELALKQEGNLLCFEKDKELEELQEKYDAMSLNFEGYNLQDLQKSINRLNERLDEIFKIKLVEITNSYDKENQKLQNLNNEKPKCSYCRQEIKNDETIKHLKNFQIKELNRLQEKADSLKEETKYLISEKDKKIELFNKLNTPDMQKLQMEKEQIKSKIDILLEEKNAVLLNNKEVYVRQEQIREAKKNIGILDKVQEEILQQLEKNNMQKKIANKLKILAIESQKERIQEHLNKVNIQLSKINKTTGEIVECCNIQYEGRDYQKLSKSQQVRTCLEISNLFNNLSRINAPIFCDDAESTTDIMEIKNTQMIISLVIKSNPLEILYDYKDVLNRKKKSIDKEIIESNNFILKEVA